MQADARRGAILAILTMVAGVAGVRAQDANAVDEIARVRGEWVAHVHAKRFDELSQLFDPDGAILVPQVGRIAGRSTIQSFYPQALGALQIEISLRSYRVLTSGDLAFDAGSFDETVTPPGSEQKQRFSGSYLMVFRRQQDGRWLILEQAWTEHPLRE